MGPLEDTLKKARMAIEMKGMEVLACREQEHELRDQLRESVEARTAAEARVVNARDEALVAFRAKEAPRIREAAISSFRKEELPALLASASDFDDADYALGQAEYLGTSLLWRSHR